MQKYQEKSEFVFDSVDSLRYNLHKISLNRGGSNIDSPEWLKNKKATVNPKNNDDKCVQYNWKDIDIPSHKKDWEKFELNNKSIALNVLYIPYNTEKIRHAYKSNYDKERENQVILSMITDGKK